ncbi:colicin-like pore-forming protein [Pseudomonas sp. B2M1-30]|uniref:colicin-like pore-forming protein n=1 Tax=Pseudomonas TaxID=286 RepID=UPI0021C94CB0|nr:MULTISPECIES: colicin-like pore-forming protein [Pseudomonas]MCU0120811.1 colicin-like pore-forming protein [Pseudomonas sp. B2M1-30]MCU7260000.1 colicin-like pore-forming protein [Pseudomonas koreensis]
MPEDNFPGIITYGDGSWEIYPLNPGRLRDDIRKNYPLGNPMHGFTLAIENDYLTRTQNLEQDLQIELNAAESTSPPFTTSSPEAWLNRAINVVNELLFQKNANLQKQLRTAQESKQHAKLQATYDSIISQKQIASLQDRQTRLYAEVARRQAEALALQQAAEAQRQAQEQARLAALAEAKRLDDEKAAAAEKARQLDDYKRSVAYVADANKYILEKYGANLHQVVTDLQKDISGKKIRSYSEAMQTFEQVRTNPNARLSPQDTRAVVDALNALDKATYMDNVNRLAKGFGVTGKIVQAHSVIEKTVIGFRDGDWKPLMLELESIAAGMGAGAILAGVIAMHAQAFAVSIPGIVIVGLLVAAVASYLDAKKVERINIILLDQLNSASST